MNKAIPLAAVIGWPVAHSRSPRLHGHWLRQNGIVGHYVPLQIAPEDFGQALSILPRIGFVGANVTIPHKQAALTLATMATPLARRIGAANTLVFGPDGILADNTDSHGFSSNILDRFPDWRPRCVAVLGAGGASRAVVAALTDLGVQEIRLANRSSDRTQALAREFPAIRPVDWAHRDAMLADCDTLVNTTSLGMSSNPPLDIDLSALPVSALVNDLVYVPLETPLLAQARLRGNPVVDGLGMLLHQAAPGFERWFGIRPIVDDQLRAAVLG